MNCSICGRTLGTSLKCKCDNPRGLTHVPSMMPLRQVPTVANMTLRDWFAGQALMGLMASRNPTSPRFHPDDDTQYVYAVADAMLKAREVKP